MKLIINIDDKDYEKLKDGHIPFSILDVIQNGIPLERLRDEIYQLHCHPKLDFIKTDEVVDMALDIIDRQIGDKE